MLWPMVRSISYGCCFNLLPLANLLHIMVLKLALLFLNLEYCGGLRFVLFLIKIAKVFMIVCTQICYFSIMLQFFCVLFLLGGGGCCVNDCFKVKSCF